MHHVMVGNLNFICDTQINSNSLSALSLLSGQILASRRGSLLTTWSLCKAYGESAHAHQMFLVFISISPLSKNLKGVKM